MLDNDTQQKIRELKEKGYSVSKIAQDLGLSRSTVRKYLDDSYDNNENPYPEDSEYMPPPSIERDDKNNLIEKGTDVEIERIKLKKAKIQKQLSALKKDEKNLLYDIYGDLLILKDISYDSIVNQHLIDLFTDYDNDDDHEFARSNREKAGIFLDLNRHYEMVKVFINEASCDITTLHGMYESFTDLGRKWARLTTGKDGKRDEKTLEVFYRLIETLKELLKTI